MKIIIIALIIQFIICEIISNIKMNSIKKYIKRRGYKIKKTSLKRKITTLFNEMIPIWGLITVLCSLIIDNNKIFNLLLKNNYLIKEVD